MNVKGPQPWDRPIFVASVTRSGSTLLQRILNVHPDVAIWGEHNGALAGLCDTWEALHADHAINHLRRGNEFAGTVVDGPQDGTEFVPWVSPFLATEFAVAIRSLIIEQFSNGVPQTTRWGFKEVRYESNTLEVLGDIFPQSHFVLLARDLDGYVASRFFVWREEQPRFDTPEDLDRARAVVQNLVNGWMARYSGYLQLAERFRSRCSFVNYATLVSGSERIPELFGEIGLSRPEDAQIDEVLRTRLGSSFGDEQARADREIVVDLVRHAEYEQDRYRAIVAAFGLG